MNKDRRYAVASLFAGCGGLDFGFLGGFTFLNKRYFKRRFDIIWANDTDKNACQTYKKNLKHEIVCDDIEKLINENKLPDKGEVDVVLGGFPCQDFSCAGKRQGFKTRRGLLYRSMAKVVKRLEPLILIAENVKGLTSSHGGGAVEIIQRDFGNLGYTVNKHIYLAANYEVPQMRQRIIFVGTKKDILPEFAHPAAILDKKDWITARTAIGDLARKKEGAVSNHFWSKAKMFPGTQGNTFINPKKPAPTIRAEHHGNIEWHYNHKRRLSAREAARLQSFPDDFIFYPSTSSAYKQIGNAVPPVMAWHIATAIQKFLDNNIRKEVKKNDMREKARCLIR